MKNDLVGRIPIDFDFSSSSDNYVYLDDENEEDLNDGKYYK